MSSTRVPVPVPWERLDTVLVDMDGTLLDLAFDNFFWGQAVPAGYAELHNMAIADATRELFMRYESVQGRLEWYCTDYWTRQLGLDIPALKWQHRHRIRYLPLAREFLASVRSREKKLLLVTNAHRDALAVKIAQTGLDRHVDDMISSHDLGAPKESPDFWSRLVEAKAIDPQRAVLIEDSLAVLECGRAFGLQTTVAVRCPDSEQPPREISGFPAVQGVADLI
jgi:HAD superfamily hydrolase (TIGR01509 family)